MNFVKIPVMKNIYLLLLFFISINLYSQTSTEKWNSYLNRYEYFDSNNNMIAYKTYNSYLKQWETYTVNNKSYEPQSNVNIPLTQQVLATKQKKYDSNIIKLNDCIDKSLKFVIVVCQEKGYDLDTTTKFCDKWKNKYISNLRNDDYSSDEYTLSVINYLKKATVDFACVELNYCN